MCITPRVLRTVSPIPGLFSVNEVMIAFVPAGTVNATCDTVLDQVEGARLAEPRPR